MISQPVPFTTGTGAHATTLCPASTDARGVATCRPSLLNELKVILNGGFRASFAGSRNHQATTDATPIIVI